MPTPRTPAGRDGRRPPAAASRRHRLPHLALLRAGVILLALAAVAGSGVDIARQDGPLVGGVFIHTVQAGESLAALGARFAVTPATLARRNGLNVKAALHPGQTLAIDNRHIIPLLEGRPLVLNLAQRLLFFTDAGRLHAYPIAVGTRGWPTPRGPFTVVEKERNPTWDVPTSIQEEMRSQGKPVITRMSPGPDNPLGALFIRLSFSNVAIHGTIAPSSIYRYASHGCIRMHPDDIAALYRGVTVGMAGVSIYEPVLVATAGGRIFLEVQPDVYRRASAPLPRVRARLAEINLTGSVDWNLAADVIRRQEGTAVDITTTPAAVD